MTVTGKSERKNLLVLAGQTNSMSGSTNDADDKSKRFFSVNIMLFIGFLQLIIYFLLKLFNFYFYLLNRIDQYNYYHYKYSSLLFLV